MGAAEYIDRKNDLTAGLEADNYILSELPEVMTTIYEEQINLVIWQRSLNPSILQYCHQLVDSYPNFNMRSVIKPKSAPQSLSSVLPDQKGRDVFIQDLTLLVEMYSCLFDLDEVGVRLQVLDRAMCPRFHTDKLGCRLVSTYVGEGTEWLHNRDIDRSKLGAGNQGLSDDKSGLYSNAASIQQACMGDVILLKGDGWYDNEGLGAVHRSPTVKHHQQRLVVTMDFA
ncbi:DUF1826 domain-containing protein [uncultured Neptuniibacter sp.]|uniref:DUF1826 domain-containing protein n=1 Tax=uncultured Neptuniibacter sp. TaxID=502143 RepID=UPI00261CF024|nr:DUF1826 domain-containing protein [uncultured Neptuniibacter sp.]